MSVKRYAACIHLLALVLLSSAVAPCLVEVAADSVYTEAQGESLSVVRPGSADEDAPNGTADEARAAADLMHLDCCAGCLTCCANCTEAAVRDAVLPFGAAMQNVVLGEHGPLGSPHSIWRPPRV